MEITSVSVHKINKENSRMKGIATVILDDVFAVHDIRIIDGEDGLFIAMPSRPAKNSEKPYRDVAHPLNHETRAMFEKAVLDAYENTPDEDSSDSIEK